MKTGEEKGGTVREGDIEKGNGILMLKFELFIVNLDF